MKNRIVVLAALFMAATAFGAFASERYQWKDAGVEDGCRIYTSEIAGRSYIAAKAECVFPAGMDVLGVILRDIAGYPQWMHDCTETAVLKTVDDGNDVFIFWFRQRIKIVSDRDMVLKSKTVSVPEKGQYFVYADSTNDTSFDAGKGYVRMPSFHSLFILEWVDRNQTRITLMIDPDLGKGVPAGPANKTIARMPLKTLKNMEKLSKLPVYTQTAKTSKYGRLIEEYAKAAGK